MTLTKRTTTSVPVRVELTSRRQISQFLESNGVLEAENDVDIVARVAGPIVKLEVEEGMQVEKDHLLAVIDDREYRNRVDAATVTRNEAKLVFERAKTAWTGKVISREEYDTARLQLEAGETGLKLAEIQLKYTEIRAPFSGLIAIRHIKLAQHVSTDAPLFRIADFDPLWCPIQVPEKDLPLLKIGQRAHLGVEAFPDTEFHARVLRISPVVDSVTGTLKVTLEVEGQEKLRPGMFASVFLETDIHQDALVIPKAALVLDSIGDTVFIAKEGRAARREVKLGFRESDAVEVLDGLHEGDRVIVLGQDGLSDGTPVAVIEEGAGAISSSSPATSASEAELDFSESSPDAARIRTTGYRKGERGSSGGPRGRRGGDGSRRGGRGIMTPEMLKDPEKLEAFKQRMRDRGRTDEEIEERLDAIRSSAR